MGKVSRFGSVYFKYWFYGVLIARWACSPKLSIITTSIKSISNSVSKVIKLTGLTDEEKRNQFLSKLKEDLQNYLTENPDYVSDIRKIISYIDENYIAGKSFYTSVKDIIGSISSFSRGKDSRGTKGGHWTERSEGSGWSDSGTPDSLFFAKQKATQRIKI